MSSFKYAWANWFIWWCWFLEIAGNEHAVTNPTNKRRRSFSFAKHHDELSTLTLKKGGAKNELPLAKKFRECHVGWLRPSDELALCGLAAFFVFSNIVTRLLLIASYPITLPTSLINLFHPIVPAAFRFYLSVGWSKTLLGAETVLPLLVFKLGLHWCSLQSRLLSKPLAICNCDTRRWFNTVFLN